MFMKKTRGLFFFGIFAIATGIGFLSTSFNNKTAIEVEAKESYLTFKDGVATLGTYPQTINNVDTTTLMTNGEPDAFGRYTYQNKQYMIAIVSPDNEYKSNQKFNDGSSVQDLNGVSKAFLVEDLKWEVLSTGDGYADLITTRIIDRQIFGGSLNYPEADIYTFNNAIFHALAFKDSDKAYLKSFDDKDPYYVNLPTEADLKDYKDDYLEYPSDYSIAATLSANPSHGETYVNAPFWTKTITVEGDRIKAFWCKSSTTNCVKSDSKIGVRPVIRVAYKGAKGGGTTTSKSSTTNSGNATLGIGISFTILGAGGLIAFFILWAKKHPSGKPPIWIIASLAGTLAISVVGLGCLAGGMTGGGAAGGSCFKTGYYVQTSQYSGGGIAQVGYTAWLIKSDGTASYCSSLNDKTNASDFTPDGYMTGTYTISGSKLVINIPKHEIKNFGTVGGTYTYTIKGCENFQNSDGAYHWVRGE